MAAQFTEGAVQMPPNAPGNVGKQNIALWSKGFLDQFHVRFALAVYEVRVFGESAFERGTNTIDLTSKAGGVPMQDIGKYLTIYQRKLGDSWRMARDIWNSNNPPPCM